MNHKVITPKGQPNVRVTQNAGDLIAGQRQGDFSRISAYAGDKGLHTGANSPTVARHNKPFGK